MTERTNDAGSSVPVQQVFTEDGIRLQVVGVDTETSRLCADLYSLTTDLKYIVDCCGVALEVQSLPEEERNAVLSRALWTSALITYGRCFNTGVRGHLDEADVTSAGPGAIQVHRHYRDLRDKHVAHAVNPFEKVLVGAVLPAPETLDPNKNIGVAISSVLLVSDTPEGLAQLQRLASHLHNRAMERLRSAQAKLQTELATVGVDELSKLPDMTHVIPGAADARTNRNAYRGSTRDPDVYEDPIP